ncbi:MAG: glycosyltransferase family 4 protein [Noviherbaspirillum sp.]
MNFLFVHQNFPGQYLHMARALAAVPGNRVVFITQRSRGNVPGVEKVVYQPGRRGSEATHRYLRDPEAHVLNAQAVARVALELKKSGFTPDLMIGHNGWGEIWYLKDIYPATPLLGYFEFYYRLSGADVGFDPAYPVNLDAGPRLRTKNLGNLLGLDAADSGICPTQWQKSIYPQQYHPMLEVIHEGIDTELLRPDVNARLCLPGTGIELGTEHEVVTYVARNLEPYRGFPSFMRSLPAVLEQRPNAHVLIVGGDDVSYGARPRDGRTYKQQMLDELGPLLDWKRVHFLGKLPYMQYLKVLQISRVHVYLTYPFVLSWSMLEAMSAGCLVIGSRTAPVEEVIRDGENGMLADFFDAAEISKKIVTALAEPERHAEIRERARRTIVECHDLKTVCLPAHLRLVRRLIGFGKSLGLAGQTGTDRRA